VLENETMAEDGANIDDPRSWSDDRLMTRADASRYAQRVFGIVIAVNTLAKAAVRGDGPPMIYFGRKPHYAVGEFRAWLIERTRRARSTSEARGATRRLRKRRTRE